MMTETNNAPAANEIRPDPSEPFLNISVLMMHKYQIRKFNVSSGNSNPSNTASPAPHVFFTCIRNIPSVVSLYALALLGTVNGASCGASLRTALSEVLHSQSQFTQVVDGRFKGGYITRHYGMPNEHMHAVQLEMCWRCYMREQAPYRYEPSLTANLQPLLRTLIQTMIDWKPHV